MTVENENTDVLFIFGTEHKVQGQNLISLTVGHSSTIFRNIPPFGKKPFGKS